MSISPSVGGTSEPTWVKSSYSDSQGGMCVEVAWTKSSHSDNEGGACVEVAASPGTILVRDSKDAHGPRLGVAPASWASFVSQLRP